jgi:hypothetical protein
MAHSRLSKWQGLQKAANESIPEQAGVCPGDGTNRHPLQRQRLMNGFRKQGKKSCIYQDKW